MSGPPNDASPLPERRHAAAVGAVVVVVTLACCVVVAMLFDEASIRWAKATLPTTSLGDLAGRLTHVGESTWIFVAAAVALVAGLALHRPRLAGTAVLFAVATAFSGILVNLLKVLFGRARPKLLEEEGALALSPFSVGYDWNSFPSGHSTTALTLAGVIWVLWPRLRWFGVGVCLVIASTRWAIAAHYPADVLAGSVLGFGCGVAIARTSPRWWPRDWSRCRTPVVSTASDESRASAPVPTRDHGS